MEVEGRQLVLSNLDKVMYPATGFTKGEVVDYYARVAPVMLPHLAGRAATRKRYPDGVDGGDFFEKNAPRHTPDWVRTATLDSPGSTKGRSTIDYVVVDGLPTLVWLANLAALELHVPQWRVDADGAPAGADLLVLDLDPGAPADVVQCCQVAVLLRDTLARPEWGGLEAWVKTSGSKGLQVYVPVAPVPWERTHAFAHALAEHLERVEHELVVSRMTRSLRPGKVLLDWSQNNGAKTTVAAYSLRARERPTASTPVTWDEVAGCRSAEQLRFTAPEVLDRVERHGDLLAPVLTQHQRLPEPPTA
ncbi:non-homologous end-joining DNA ligase [Motilibacter rhizosphaerae]|uniref:non-homologous end-joining DNA ligase n=1 Tax=Motilibacter rhizosphaerae TaxID=598652 RepID=UPI00102BA9F3|nr:non-homologous end-joining DNA ligase [Motilibacter rhizosphaerae]